MEYLFLFLGSMALNAIPYFVGYILLSLIPKEKGEKEEKRPSRGDGKGAIAVIDGKRVRLPADPAAAARVIAARVPEGSNVKLIHANEELKMLLIGMGIDPV